MENTKGRLQEMFQGTGAPLPQYDIKTSGQSHSPIVECTVTVHWNNTILREKAVYQGKKREAERMAATKMLDTIRDLEDGAAGPRRSRRTASLSPHPADYRRSSLSPASSPHRPPSPRQMKSPVASMMQDQDPLDDLSIAMIASLSPAYHYWHNETGESRRVSCLACAVGVEAVSYPITGHGSGETEAIARNLAIRCLLANYHLLSET